MRYSALAIFVAILLPAWLTVGQAQDKKDKDYASELPRIAPKTPAEAVKTFKLADGFKIELAASEPAIRSPVALDIDEDGRMYVVEFPEYNQHRNPNFKERGAIKLLEDTKGTGVYDKVTTFAEIDSPVAIACWDGGVFVGAVPDIWYLKDTKGTGKADVKKIIYTGFGRDKAGEAMLNSFRWGLDNRFHASTSAAGGNVKRAEAKDAKLFNVKGHSFLFDPRSLKFDLVAGSAQHGMSMDDWGRTFTCDNSNPAHLLMYDGRYLQKNPYVQAPPPLLNIHTAERKNYLKRISPNEPWRVVRTRLRLSGAVPGPTETGEVSGHFTGTTGVTVYRGDAFPPEYRGTLFVGEVSNNLVFHAKLEPKGVALAASRFEKDGEFLASTDNWFRPCQFANAPDGSLYVIDHYREIIETVESIPPDILKHLHIESGVNHGRIWRVVPDGFKRRPTPKLSRATTTELVKLLEHPNGWHRDTASRLLYQRQDNSAVPALTALVNTPENPLARVHALYALAGLNALQAEHVMTGLLAEDAHVREHALRLAEAFQDDAAIPRRMIKMASNVSPRVRLQLAFSAGMVEGEWRTQILYALAKRDISDPWMRLSILTSAHGKRGDLFSYLVRDAKGRPSPERVQFLKELAVQTGAANQAHEVVECMTAIEKLPEAQGRELIASLISKMPAKAQKIITSAKARDLLDGVWIGALRTANDEKKPSDERAAAIRTLSLQPSRFGKILKQQFTYFLEFRQPEPVQKAALESLMRIENAGVADIIIDAWPGLSPKLRASAAETLFVRTASVNSFLDAVEKGKIKPSEIDPARIELLQKFGDPKTRKRAESLFKGTALSKRKDVVDAYQKALTLKADAANGKALFKKHCSACHRLEGVGEQIGAELGAIKDRGADFILLNVLDPNREVLPKFITYYVVTDAGLTLTGMITAETATSITLRRPDGTSETVLRVNISELRSTGMSFMPEGLEKSINHQEMADLMGYLLSVK